MSAALPALQLVLAALAAAPAPVPATIHARDTPQAFGGTGRAARPVPTRLSSHPARRHPRNGRRCARVGHSRICTTYRHGRAVRVCTRGLCRRARRAHASAAPAANRYEGWWVPRGPAAMGRLWVTDGPTTRGWCSGTVITADVVLTAGHCLWAGGYLSNSSALTFVPGNAFAGNGVDGEAATAATPYGSWRIKRSYAPRCWTRSRDPHCDVGLAVLARSHGRRAGDVVGTVAAWTGSCCSAGQQLVNAGYPGVGRRFHRYAGGYGNAPYFCRNRFRRHSRTRQGSGELDWVSCEMTAGASGGPVWSRLGDGAYHLVGVNNRRSGGMIGFQPLDGVFAQLYCSVMRCRAK